MMKSIFKIAALGLCAVMVFALPGCNSKKAEQDTQTTQQVEAISEIDSFVISVQVVKNSFDQNKMYKEHVEEAKSQAMIMEGFLDEMPNLYQEAEYKSKITEVYNMINAMDINKNGLQKEDGAESNFNSLKQIVTRMYNKFE